MARTPHPGGRRQRAAGRDVDVECGSASADGLIDHVFPCEDTRGCHCDPQNAVGGRPGPDGERRQAKPDHDVNEDWDRAHQPKESDQEGRSESNRQGQSLSVSVCACSRTRSGSSIPRPFGVQSSWTIEQRSSSRMRLILSRSGKAPADPEPALPRPNLGEIDPWASRSRSCRSSNSARSRRGSLGHSSGRSRRRSARSGPWRSWPR